MGTLRVRLWIVTWPRPLLEVYKRRRIESCGERAGKHITCPAACITRFAFDLRGGELSEGTRLGRREEMMVIVQANGVHWQDMLFTWIGLKYGRKQSLPEYPRCGLLYSQQEKEI